MRSLILHIRADVETLSDLDRRVTELVFDCKRILDLKDQEIAVLNRNFDQMKDVSDRAIKLAEIGKPKSNWELQGLLRLAAFLGGFLLAK